MAKSGRDAESERLPLWSSRLESWPAIWHGTIAELLLAIVAMLDVTWSGLSIFYFLPALYMARTIRGRVRWIHYAAVVFVVLLIPFLSTPSRVSTRTMLGRTSGISMGLLMAYLIRDRQQFSERLKRSNEQLQIRVAEDSRDLGSVNRRLDLGKQQLQQRIFELTVLNRVGVLCSESSTEDELLHRTTTLIAEALFPDNCGFLLMDADRNVLVTHPSFVLSDPTVSRADKPLGMGITGQVALTGHAQCVGEVSQKPGYLAADSSTRSEMCIPMKIASRVVGVLNVESRKPNAFSSIDEQLAITVVDLVGNSLERLRSAQALRWNEKRLQQLFDSSPDAVFVEDLNGQVLDVNPAACRLHEMDRTELIGKNMLELVPPADRTISAAAFQQTISDKMTELEGFSWTKSQTAIPVELRVNRIDYFGQPALLLHVRDITARRRVEQALRHSELQFALFMQHLPGLAWIKDDEGRYVFANAAAEKVFGAPLSVLIGKTDHDLFPPETAAQFQVADRKALASGTEVRTIESLKHGDGVLHHSIVSKFRFPCAGDLRKLVGGMAIDITEQRQAEEALQMMRFSVDHAGDSVFWISRDGRYLYANDAACTSRGFTRDELLSMTVFDLDPDFQPAVWDPHFEDLKRHGTLTFESRHRAKDGRIFPIEVNANYVHVGGQEFNFAFVRDITERKRNESVLRESEAQFRLLFEGANDAIFWANAETGLLTHCNAAAEKLLGREHAEIIGQHQSFLHPPEEVARYRELFRAHGTAQSKTPIEVEVLRKDGRRVDVSISPSVTDIAGQRIIQGIFRDISERKQMEKELSVRQRELLHASRLSAIGQMVAGLSHEVAQPLNAISNFAVASTQLLNSDTAGPSDKLKEYVQTINDQSRRCAAILQRLRDFSRRVPTLKVLCDLNPLLRESVELIASETRRREARIQLELADELPQIAADRVQIQQVVFNLLNNALDAVRDQNLERRRMTVRSYAETNAVVLEVEDHGPGIVQEITQQLFEPFITTKQDGMGIGLSISKTIVSDHGGTIEASANHFGGATFRVRLPCSYDVNYSN